MDSDDVAPADMPWFRAPDPLDAAVRGEPVDDPAVEALVADLRDAYLPRTEPARSPALAAFAGPSAGRAVTAPQAIAPAASGGRRRARAATAALVGTVTGKVLLGGAVAAAAMGGLHAAEVVDVPVLPDVGRSAPAEAPAEPTTPTVEVPAPLPDAAEHGVVSGGGEREPGLPATDPGPPPAWPTDQVPSEAGSGPPTSPADPPWPKPAPRDAPAADPPAADPPAADLPAVGPAPAPEPAPPGPPASGGDAGRNSGAGAAPEAAPTAPADAPAPISPSRP